VDRDHNGKTTHEDNYIRIKILTEEGRQHGNVEIAFNKANEDIVNVHGQPLSRMDRASTSTAKFLRKRSKRLRA
jgi:hypothetical protein